MNRDEVKNQYNDHLKDSAIKSKDAQVQAILQCAAMLNFWLADIAQCLDDANKSGAGLSLADIRTKAGAP